MTDTPKASAGWYPHPSMVDTRRYWDGDAWTDHIAPAKAAAAAPHQGLAWVMALSPLAWFPLVMLTGSAWVSALGVFALFAALALADARRLRTAGFRIPEADILVPPLYMADRTRVAKQPAVVGLVWLLCTASTFAPALVFALANG